MKKVLVAMFVVSLLVFGVANNLIIRGSNTVFPVSQLWIEELNRIDPNFNASLEGAGSSTGIASLFDGTADVGNSSRFLRESEIQRMLEEGKYVVPIVFGYDGIAVIVNKNLNIDNITFDTLLDIYTGKITTWNQVNPNLPRQRILAYSRNTASGTYETFNNVAMGGERMAPTVRMVESTQVIINSVANNQYAIAYAGLGYVSEDVKVLTVEGVYPTKQGIISGEYGISRPLFYFIEVSQGWPKPGLLKQFIDFSMSKRGQELVEQAGYVAAVQ